MEDKTAVDVLREARELIAKPGGWTQGAYARDINRLSRDESSSFAVCFCTMGAINRAASHAPFEAFRTAMSAIRSQIHSGTVVDWNDRPERTQAEVVALFDAAISRASR